MTIPVYVLVGAGGTGSILYQPMMRFLRTFHGRDTFVVAVIDGDHIEEKNLERQLFSAIEIQNNKAQALVTGDGDREARAITEYLGDDNVTDRIREGDTVLICADNYDVRARIERRALELDNVTVINGGNESIDGSVQVFVRRDGANVTPPLSYQHPEILRPSPHDPSKMSCLQKAEVKGGEQTIVANMMSATLMLNALRHVLADSYDASGRWSWHEAYFDLDTVAMRADDLRDSKGTWEEYSPTVLA
jgi:molybdopterin/thiamine biosynthesis adenylyltransferase